MQYFVKRGEERFGPYSLADLQKYVQSGNVMTDDLTQSEGMDSWVPVSQVLGNIPSPSLVPVVAEVEPEPIPLPPNLHWSIVLILGLLTRQLFNIIWALVLANWARKLSGSNKAMVLVAMYPAGMVAGILTIMLWKDGAVLGMLFIFAGAIVYLFGVFAIKADVEEYYTYRERIGLGLSGVMTFFFSTVYIQYHVNRLARYKKTGVLS